ncbi:acetyltransferase [Xylaria palmicola]|nr:acetyltransferase [Xylaria palmicola]
MATQNDKASSPAMTANSPPAAASGHEIPATAILATDKIYLRPYDDADVDAMTEATNDAEIAKNLRSRFPSPYTADDARAWLAHCRSQPPPVASFGVFTLDGEMAGSVGLEAPKGDPIYAGTRELGYFGARKFWGRGIMSAAVREFTRWAFATHPDLLRIEASVFEHNEGSRRVLQKAGFVKEGTRRLALVKDGKQMNEDIFGLLRTDIAK